MLHAADHAPMTLKDDDACASRDNLTEVPRKHWRDGQSHRPEEFLQSRAKKDYSVVALPCFEARPYRRKACITLPTLATSRYITTRGKTSAGMYLYLEYKYYCISTTAGWTDLRRPPSAQHCHDDDVKHESRQAGLKIARVATTDIRHQPKHHSINFLFSGQNDNAPHVDDLQHCVHYSLEYYK
jgi:hypothetical protein